VQSNGPGVPVAVHPYGGNGSTSGPARLFVSVGHQTASYRFGLRAIHNPRRVEIRARNQGGAHTRFYTRRL
jgi:hypothetical protein